MNAVVTAELLAVRVSERLRARFGPLRHGAKALAREASVTPRTAENWLAGLNAPRAAELIRLMAANDDLAADIMRLVQECKCELS